MTGFDFVLYCIGALILCVCAAVAAFIVIVFCVAVSVIRERRREQPKQLDLQNAIVNQVRAAHGLPPISAGGPP